MSDMDDEFMEDDENYDLVRACVRASRSRVRRALLHLSLRSLQEYTSEEEGSEPDADLENQYYQSKALKESSPSAAIGSFEKVRLLCRQLLVCIDRPVPHYSSVVSCKTCAASCAIASSGCVRCIH